MILGEERYRAAMSQRQLAEAAGCSRQYVEQLESGRRRAPSARTVRALADALRLEGAERRRLFAAASLEDGASASATPLEALQELAESTIAALRYPAYVLVGPFQYVSAWNAMAGPVFEISLNQPPRGATSLLELVFEAPLRVRIDPWGRLAQLLVAAFKRDTRHLTHRPEYKPFVARLRRLPDLAGLLRSVPPADHSSSSIPFILNHTRLGPLSLRAAVTLFPESHEIRIVGFVPEDARTAELLEKLAAQNASGPAVSTTRPPRR